MHGTADILFHHNKCNKILINTLNPAFFDQNQTTTNFFSFTMMVWRVIVSIVFAVAVHSGESDDEENSPGNQLLPEDTLVQVARYLDSRAKAAMEKTSRSFASSVSKAREHEIESLEIYRKYKDLIDNTDLTTEQIYKSFTWNPPVVGNGPAHHPKRVQRRNPCQVLGADDVVNGGVHESYLAVKVIAERFAGPFVVCFIFRNGQLDDQWFFRNGHWLDVHSRAANDYLPYSQIQDLILKQWVCVSRTWNLRVL